MTDSHIHGENNPAYIEDLLSRLRESIGQETPTSCESVEQEGVLNSPIAEEETLTIDAPVEDVLEGVAMEESEAPVEEELEIPVTEEVAEEPAEEVVMEVLEEISEPAEEIVLEDTADETAEEETPAEEPVVLDVEEVLPLEEVAPETTQEIAEESVPVLETVEEVALAEVVEETTPVLETVAEEIPSAKTPAEEEITDVVEPETSIVETEETEEVLPLEETVEEITEEVAPVEETTPVVPQEEPTLESALESIHDAFDELVLGDAVADTELDLSTVEDILSSGPKEEEIEVPLFFTSEPVRDTQAYAHRVVPGMSYVTEPSLQQAIPVSAPAVHDETGDVYVEDGQYALTLPIPDGEEGSAAFFSTTEETPAITHDTKGGVDGQISIFDMEEPEIPVQEEAPVADELPPVWEVTDLSVGSADTDEVSAEESAPQEVSNGPKFWEFRIPDKTFSDTAFREDGTIVDQVFHEPIEEPETLQEKISLWKRELKRRSLWTGVRSIAVGFIALLLMLYELFPVLTEKMLQGLLLTRVPGALVLIDLQLILIAAFISYPILLRGIEALRYRRVLPETLAALSAIVAVLFDIVLYAVKPTMPLLVGFVGVLTLLGAALGEFFRMKALSCAFHAYEVNGHHFAALLTPAQKHSLLSSLYREEEGLAPVLEAEAVSEIRDYIAACRTRREGYKGACFALVVATASAFVDLIVTLCLKQGATYSFWSSVTIFCGVLPLTAFVTHRFLFFSFNWRIAKERVGIADEDTIYQYAKTKIMAFDDLEAFPVGSVQVNGIKLCGDFRLDKALFLVASLFDRVGGPLNSVFRVSTQDMPLSNEVMLREIHHNGIEAQVSQEDVSVGTKEFLVSLGIQVPDDPEDDRAGEMKNHVLYVAYKGQLCAKFYVQYHMNTTFERNVEFCAKNGMSCLIMTADPLLNEALVDEVSYISEYDIRVVKRTVAELTEEKNIPRSATLVTYGPRKTLRRMPFFFGTYVKQQRVATIVSLCLALLGGILIPLLMGIFHSETALIPFLYQVVALIPAVGIGISIGYMIPT